MEKKEWKAYIAEMVGTMVLTLMGCGVAVISGGNLVATALAFGLAIVAMAYCIGDISGCHINPAVSLALRVDDRIDTKTMVLYWVFQFVGGIVGAGLLYYIVVANGMDVVIGDNIVAGLGTNGFFGQGAYSITMVGAIVVEILLTIFFTLTVLGVTNSKKTAEQAGLAIGGSLTFVHLLGIGLTGTSVNPARSVGPAIFLAVAGTTIALEQVWVFIAAPLVGALIAGLLYKHVFKPESA
ncbi:MAG: aquaporin [Methanomassiliicoccaceae archaeon]|nr:aquaporin [Methanomassiliicoccaceae archaeon]